MKILFVSMHSIHVTRWIKNLKETPHKLYWFDILNKGKLETLERVEQITHWKKRKLPYVKGEYWLSKKMPKLFKRIQPFLEVSKSEALERILNDIQPDLVHSFEMQNCSYPILNVMQKHLDIKWVYSCWGNDLYYFKNIKKERFRIEKVLSRVDFLHTDCLRDYKIAKSLGFKGKHLGVIPGGAGYKIDEIKQFKLPIEERKIILVKGYQHLFGRALNVIKALQLLKSDLKGKEVVVFGAHPEVSKYIVKNNLPFTIYKRDEGLDHTEILKLMGKTLIYIGNSISDGMPNSLLEAIIMNAFPIQSNPGNVTLEIINNDLNGLLINNPEDVNEIKLLIKKAIRYNKDGKFVKAAYINTEIAENRLAFKLNKQKIINLYSKISDS